MNRTCIVGTLRSLTALPLLTIAAACGGGPAAPPAPAPEPGAASAAATITATDMGRHIGALAHDSMRGRDTPSPELEKAATYLARQFEAMGLEPAGDEGSYIHRWEYERSRLASEETVVRIKAGGPSPRYEHDFFLVPGMQESTEATAFYAGVAGETGALPAEARGTFVVIDHPLAEVDQEWQQKLMQALQPVMMGGAAGMLLVLHPEFPGEMMASLAEATASQQAPFPIVGITDDAARQLIASAGGDLDALREAGEGSGVGSAVFEITSRTVDDAHTPPNVVAMIRGSDPTLRDSYVVVTAHFDHVGVGAADQTGDSIFNGADDDASGTAAILEIAEAFASLPEPPGRSVVFLAVSGEEKGLLGSMAWVESPTVPLDGIVANINMDMIGRNAPDTVIGIGQEYSSLEAVLRQIQHDRTDIGLNVILDPEPEEMFFFRSDQLPFIQRGIPAVFFTTGDHEDYHRQSDEPETIDADKAARVARLAFYLAHAIAVDPEDPEWTEEGWSEVQQMLQQSPF